MWITLALPVEMAGLVRQRFSTAFAAGGRIAAQSWAGLLRPMISRTLAGQADGFGAVGVEHGDRQAVHAEGDAAGMGRLAVGVRDLQVVPKWSR